MKAIITKSLSAFLLSGLLITGAIAQGPGQGRNGQGFARAGNNPDQLRIERIITDLSAEQIEDLKELRTAQMKAQRDFSNQMGEIRAQKRTLLSADDLDKKAIENLIDEKSELMNAREKSNLQHQIAVREILTDDQLLELQTYKLQHRRHGPNMQGKNFHQGQGRGNFQAGQRPHRNFQR